MQKQYRIAVGLVEIERARCMSVCNKTGCNRDTDIGNSSTAGRPRHLGLNSTRASLQALCKFNLVDMNPAQNPKLYGVQLMNSSLTPCVTLLPEAVESGSNKCAVQVALGVSWFSCWLS